VQVRTNSKKQQIQRRQLDAGPTTSPCKPTASMHMSAASYCRASALTRFIDARYGRTARAAGCRARALVRGGRNSSAWALRQPRRRSFMAPQCSRRPCCGARPLPSSRACAWYRTGPPTHAHRGNRAISKSARRPCMSTASWATCAARPTALTATRGTTLTMPRTLDRTCSGRRLHTERERETERQRVRLRHTHTHTCTGAHAYTHTHTHTRTQTHMRTHTYIHAYTHTWYLVV
jgi:hypothetical protein